MKFEPEVVALLERIAVAVETLAFPKRWEYRSEGDLSVMEMDAIGADGWELVGAWDGACRFKREVRE